MNYPALSVLGVLLTSFALGGCTTGTDTAPAVAPDSSYKMTAPVRIEAPRMGVGDASVELTFEAVAEDVTVEVYGVDGLVVLTEAKPIVSAAFPSGSKQTLEVLFRPGPGRSLLAVHVQGKFNGSTSKKVITFPVGSPAPTDGTTTEPGTAGTVEVDSNGERVHVTPAKKN